MKERIIVKNGKLEDELISQALKEYMAKCQLESEQITLRSESARIENKLRSLAQKIPEQDEKIFLNLGKLANLRKK